MAEAHSAAALSFSLTHDGVSVSYDQVRQGLLGDGETQIKLITIYVLPHLLVYIAISAVIFLWW